MTRVVHGLFSGVSHRVKYAMSANIMLFGGPRMAPVCAAVILASPIIGYTVFASPDSQALTVPGTAGGTVTGFVPDAAHSFRLTGGAGTSTVAPAAAGLASINDGRRGRSRGWVAVEARLPGGANAVPDVALSAVTCPSATRCVAIGSYTDSAGNPQGLIETLSGARWAAAKAPLPADAGVYPDSQLSTVACSSDALCAAAGHYADSAGHGQGLLETLSGATWQPTQAPLPGGASPGPEAGAEPDSVACPSAASCIATGAYQTTAGSFQGLIETLSGTTWTATQAPLPADAVTGQHSFAVLRSIVCWSATSCVAAGYYTASTGGVQGLLETLSGTTWTPTRAPLPAGASASWGAFLYSVACSSAASCVAAGYYGVSPLGAQGLIETLLGTTWTATQAPLPVNANAKPAVRLNSVTCPSATSCVIAGTYADSSDNEHGLIETRSGTNWAATDVTLPADAGTDPETMLSAVACSSGTSCVATGYYTYLPGYQQGLLVTLSGTTWTAIRAPLPADVSTYPYVGLPAVACPAAASCTAVGNYAGRSGDPQGLLETQFRAVRHRRALESRRRCRC